MIFASRKVNEGRLDALFTTLQDELSDTQGNFSCARLVDRMRKRAAYHRPELDQVAVAKFIAINNEVRTHAISLDAEIVDNARHFLTVVLERFTTAYCETNVQNVLDSRYLYDNWRFGPGASFGIDGTHTVEKIIQDMTVTSSCVPLISNLRLSNPYFASFDRGNKRLGYTVVEGSRLTTVPKNEDTVRTIAIEPSGNMALQLAAGSYLEGVLRMIGLDITCQQPKNKAMALRGSIDGSIATIDLASASDRISIELVRVLMPPKWFHLLMSLRSPRMELPKGEGVLELAMISTMGNGFTFPLMTLLLVSLIYANRCVNFSGPTLYVSWRDTCVYGDDIIVPVREYGKLCEVLYQAGFVVNHEKSYSEGAFRESCGGDYNGGVDVTPFYVKSLSCDSEIYVAINQVLEWCAKNRHILPLTLTLLRSYVDTLRLVPEWHNPDEGVLTSQCGRRYTYLRVRSTREKVRDDHPFLVPLAAGGYVEGHKLGFCTYTPRPFKNEVRAKSARLPNGYLDGSDRVKRSELTTDYIASYMFLLN